MKLIKADELDRQMQKRWKQFSSDVKILVHSTPQFLGSANPPNEAGIYIFYNEQNILFT